VVRDASCDGCEDHTFVGGVVAADDGEPFLASSSLMLAPSASGRETRGR